MGILPGWRCNFLGLSISVPQGRVFGRLAVSISSQPPPFNPVLEDLCHQVLSQPEPQSGLPAAVKEILGLGGSFMNNLFANTKPYDGSQIRILGVNLGVAK
jgi:hypothetical protein